MTCAPLPPPSSRQSVVVDERGLSVRLVRLDGVVELRLHGELDVATAPALQAAVEQLQDPGRVVLDLAELEFADMVGLNTLLALRRTARVEVRRPRPALVLLASTAGVADALGVSALASVRRTGRQLRAFSSTVPGGGAPGSATARAACSAEPGATTASAGLAGVTERLLAEFATAVAPAVVRATVADCVRDLAGAPAAALPELVERSARQRLSGPPAGR